MASSLNYLGDCAKSLRMMDSFLSDFSLNSSDWTMFLFSVSWLSKLSVCKSDILLYFYWYARYLSVNGRYQKVL